MYLLVPTPWCRSTFFFVGSKWWLSEVASNFTATVAVNGDRMMFIARISTHRPLLLSHGLFVRWDFFSNTYIYECISVCVYIYIRMFVYVDIIFVSLFLHFALENDGCASPQSTQIYTENIGFDPCPDF